MRTSWNERASEEGEAPDGTCVAAKNEVSQSVPYLHIRLAPHPNSRFSLLLRAATQSTRGTEPGMSPSPAAASVDKLLLQAVYRLSQPDAVEQSARRLHASSSRSWREKGLLKPESGRTESAKKGKMIADGAITSIEFLSPWHQVLFPPCTCSISKNTCFTLL
jgi:hypothetical protein